MKYDVILYGATGFTGKRAVQYFKDHAPKSVKWAIAARNEAKLSALKQTLNLEVDILVADALQEAEIKILVQKNQRDFVDGRTFCTVWVCTSQALCRFGRTLCRYYRRSTLG
jgi:NADP-dependent 3-hydroxy acid dehydrogenase YdfG